MCACDEPSPRATTSSGNNNNGGKGVQHAVPAADVKANNGGSGASERVAASSRRGERHGDDPASAARAGGGSGGDDGGGGEGGNFATSLVKLIKDAPDPNDPAVIAATIKLQSAGRGHLARAAANNLRAEHADLKKRDRAATVIQAALKGWKDRVAVRRRRVDIAHGQQTCVCNKPPWGKMAMCQECYELCHLTCVGLPSTGSDWRVALEGKPFVCPRCVRVAAAARAAELEGADSEAAAEAQRNRAEAVYVSRRAAANLPPGVALTRVRAKDEKDFKMLGLLGVELVNRGDKRGTGGGAATRGGAGEEGGYLDGLARRLQSSSLPEKLKSSVSERLMRVRKEGGVEAAEAGAKKIGEQVALVAREAGGQPSSAVPPRAMTPMNAAGLGGRRPPIVNVAPPPTPPSADDAAMISAAEALKQQEAEVRNRKIAQMEREAAALKEQEDNLARELERARAMAAAMEREAEAAAAREAAAREAVQERWVSPVVPSVQPPPAAPPPPVPPPAMPPPPPPAPVAPAAPPPAAPPPAPAPAPPSEAPPTERAKYDDFGGVNFAPPIGSRPKVPAAAAAPPPAPPPAPQAATAAAPPPPAPPPAPPAAPPSASAPPPAAAPPAPTPAPPTPAPPAAPQPAPPAAPAPLPQPPPPGGAAAMPQPPRADGGGVKKARGAPRPGRRTAGGAGDAGVAAAGAGAGAEDEAGAAGEEVDAAAVKKKRPSRKK